jgi:hypothetical protein
MQTINQFISQIEIESLILGISLGVLLVIIFLWIKTFFRKKPIGLPLLRNKIEIGHEALKQANQIFSEIYSAFNDTEEMIRG